MKYALPIDPPTQDLIDLMHMERGSVVRVPASQTWVKNLKANKRARILAGIG